MPQETKEAKPKKKKLVSPRMPARYNFANDLEGEKAYQSAMKKYKVDYAEYLKKQKAEKERLDKVLSGAIKKAKPVEKEKPTPKKTEPKAGESLTAKYDALKLNPPVRGESETFAEYVGRIKEHKEKLKDLEQKIKDAKKEKK